jgi:ParB/RepB/Spo0J family partition protein
MSLTDTSQLSTVQLPLDQVDPDPEQVRQERDPQADALLLGSIAKQGQLVPVHVVAVGIRWKLIDGHGRYLSLKRIGAETIAAIILSNELNTSDLLIRSLVLNCCRSDLHFLDRGTAYQQLLKQHGWTQSKLAEQTGEDLPTVNKLLSIAALDHATQETIRASAIGFVKAYQLSKLIPDDRERQLQGMSSGEARTDAKSTATVSMKRVACPLASGITVAVHGPALTMEDFLFSLEYVLREGRKCKSKNMDVTTLGKLFHDQAKAGGKS